MTYRRKSEFESPEEFERYKTILQIRKEARKVIKSNGGKDIIIWHEPIKKRKPYRKRYGTQRVITSSGRRQSALPPMKGSASSIITDWILEDLERQEQNNVNNK